MGTTPSTFPASVASFTTNTFDFDPLVAGETISISAQLSSGQGILHRGQVLCGWTAGTARSVALSTTGSACAILAQDIDTGTGAAVTAIVYVQGKFLVTAITASGNGMELDAAELWNVGVYLMTVEQRSGLLIPWTQLPATPSQPLPQVGPLSAGGSPVTLSPTSATVLASGGSGSFTVTTPGQWTVSGVPSWAQFSPMSGAGDATVSYTVNTNSTGQPLQALVDVSGSKFTLNVGAA